LRKLKPFFDRIPYQKEVNEVYFKPYMTWAIKEKLPNFNKVRTIEESH
jgi:hypothetical protein